MIFIILIIANVLLTLIIKNAKRYWIVCIPLLAFLIISFAGWRIINDRKYNLQKDLYWKSVANKSYGDFKEWTKLNKLEEEGQKINIVFFDLLVLQAFITFILQVIGKRNTKAKVYKWTSWIVGILFLSLFWIRLMFAIIPYGMVT
jgi:hypothetical protein